MSGDRGLLFSRVSDVRTTEQVACVSIKLKVVLKWSCSLVDMLKITVRWNTGRKPEKLRGKTLGCILGHGGGNLDFDPHTTKHPLCSVVVEALAGLLEVTIAFLCWVEPCLSQILPVEGTAAQPLSFGLGPGPLDSQQLDVAWQRNSPCSQTPRYMSPHCHWPGQTQGKCYRLWWWNITLNTYILQVILYTSWDCAQCGGLF